MRKVEVGRRNYIGNDGKSYTVVEWVNMVSENMISGQRPTAYGTTEVLLADGTSLLDTDEDDVFEISTSGVIIRPA
jgi:hypothetical protein